MWGWSRQGRGPALCLRGEHRGGQRAGSPPRTPGWAARAVPTSVAARGPGGRVSAPLPVGVGLQETGRRDSWGQRPAGRPGVGAPPPPSQGPVGEAQLLPWLRARVSGQDSPTGCCRDGPAFRPPPPGFWGWGSWEAGAGGGCPTQGREHALGTTLATRGARALPEPGLPQHRGEGPAVRHSPHWHRPPPAWGLDGGAPSQPQSPQPVPAEPPASSAMAWGLGGPGRAAAPSSTEMSSRGECASLLPLGRGLLGSCSAPEGQPPGLRVSAQGWRVSPRWRCLPISPGRAPGLCPL